MLMVYQLTDELRAFVTIAIQTEKTGTIKPATHAKLAVARRLPAHVVSGDNTIAMLTTPDNDRLNDLHITRQR